MLILDLPLNQMFLKIYVFTLMCFFLLENVNCVEFGGRGGGAIEWEVGYFSKFGNLGGVNYLKWVGTFSKI